MKLTTRDVLIIIFASIWFLVLRLFLAQHLRCLLLILFNSDSERRSPIIVKHIDLGSASEQQFDQFDQSITRRVMERRPSGARPAFTAALGVHIRPALDK